FPESMSAEWTGRAVIARCPGGHAARRPSPRPQSLAASMALFRRLAQGTRMDPVVELGSLPLRTEQALLDRAYLRRAYFVAGCAQVSHALEAHVDHCGAGNGALEQNFLRVRDHGEPAFGMVEQVLRRHDDRKILDRARPNERAPSRPEFALILARWHEDELGAAQGERAGDLRHVDLAAHREPDLAVHGVEHREFVSRHPLEFPRRPTGVDPWAVGM